MEIGVIINFLVALGIGTIMGLEREIIHQRENVKEVGGIRTFILVSIMGFLLMYTSLNIFKSQFFFIVGFTAFLILLIASHIILAMKTDRVGTTTDIAAIMVFILSSLLAVESGSDYRLPSIILAILIASLLAFKENLHKFAKKVQMNEVFAAIKMALISVIILPFLPNKDYTLLNVPILKDFILQFPKIVPTITQLDVFNPFKIWLIVVFISGLSFLGYILVKVVGAKKGIGLTSFLGGIVSSTAVTVSLSKRSKESKVIRPLALGIILASSIMFIRVLVEVLVLNSSLFSSVFFPLFMMAIVGLICAFAVSFKTKEKGKDIKFSNPFDLWPAIKFGFFFLFVLIASKLLYSYFGNSGIYLAALISGLADVDPMVISASTLALSSTISPGTAVLSIILALFSNTIVKAGIVYSLGEKKVAKIVAISFALILAVGFAIAFLLN